MPISADWDNPEKTIIRYVISNPWSLDELYERQADVRVMLETVDHTVHLITELKPPIVPPKNALVNLKRATGIAADNEGVHYVVGSGALLQTVYGVMQKILPSVIERMHFVPTLEEARAALAQIIAEENKS